jgi:hypothetical protein
MPELKSFVSSPIEACSSGASTPLLGFIDETRFKFFIRMCCLYAAVLSLAPHLIHLQLRFIEKVHGLRLFWIIRRIFIPMVFSSMINQFATAFAARPLEMVSDLQFNSLFSVQIIGYLISLFSAFVFGVVFASLQVSEPSLHSS